MDDLTRFFHHQHQSPFNSAVGAERAGCPPSCPVAGAGERAAPMQPAPRPVYQPPMSSALSLYSPTMTGGAPLYPSQQEPIIGGPFKQISTVPPPRYQITTLAPPGYHVLTFAPPGYELAAGKLPVQQITGMTPPTVQVAAGTLKHQGTRGIETSHAGVKAVPAHPWLRSTRQLSSQEPAEGSSRVVRPAASYPLNMLAIEQTKANQTTLLEPERASAFSAFLPAASTNWNPVMEKPMEVRGYPRNHRFIPEPREVTVPQAVRPVFYNQFPFEDPNRNIMCGVSGREQQQALPPLQSLGLSNSQIQTEKTSAVFDTCGSAFSPQNTTVHKPGEAIGYLRNFLPQPHWSSSNINQPTLNVQDPVVNRTVEVTINRRSHKEHESRFVPAVVAPVRMGPSGQGEHTWIHQELQQVNQELQQVIPIFEPNNSVSKMQFQNKRASHDTRAVSSPWHPPRDGSLEVGDYQRSAWHKPQKSSGSFGITQPAVNTGVDRAMEIEGCRQPFWNQLHWSSSRPITETIPIKDDDPKLGNTLVTTLHQSNRWDVPAVKKESASLEEYGIQFLYEFQRRIEPQGLKNWQKQEIVKPKRTPVPIAENRLASTQHPARNRQAVAVSECYRQPLWILPNEASTHHANVQLTNFVQKPGEDRQFETGISRLEKAIHAPIFQPRGLSHTQLKPEKPAPLADSAKPSITHNVVVDQPINVPSNQPASNTQNVVGSPVDVGINSPTDNSQKVVDEPVDVAIDRPAGNSEKVVDLPFDVEIDHLANNSQKLIDEPVNIHPASHSQKVVDKPVDVWPESPARTTQNIVVDNPFEISNNCLAINIQKNEDKERPSVSSTENQEENDRPTSRKPKWILPEKITPLALTKPANSIQKPVIDKPVKVDGYQRSPGAILERALVVPEDGQPRNTFQDPVIDKPTVSDQHPVADESMEVGEGIDPVIPEPEPDKESASEGAPASSADPQPANSSNKAVLDNPEKVKRRNRTLWLFPEKADVQPANTYQNPGEISA